MNWRWISKQALLLLHDESLAEHGGAAGIRDEGLLDSALARPLNLETYGAPDFADLAASYAIGLAKNHAFVDGNKRAAFLATGLFLHLNGYRLNASQADATLTLFAAAAGEIDEAQFSAWLCRHCVKQR
jgi:death-on-curing protein